MADIPVWLKQGFLRFLERRRFLALARPTS